VLWSAVFLLLFVLTHFLERLTLIIRHLSWDI